MVPAPGCVIADVPHILKPNGEQRIHTNGRTIDRLYSSKFDGWRLLQDLFGPGDDRGFRAFRVTFDDVHTQDQVGPHNRPG